MLLGYGIIAVPAGIVTAELNNSNSNTPTSIAYPSLIKTALDENITAPNQDTDKPG